MEHELIKHNPLLKKPALLMLALVETTAERTALEEAAAAAWAPNFAQSPAATIDILVRAGALEEQLLINGEPYEGTLEDVQFDETVPDNASFENRVAVTETGRAIARAYDPKNLTADLLATRPAYAPVFRALIACCSAPDGATLPAMEAVVEAQPEAAVNAEGKKVYPQYFIDALETAGAIEWNGAWRATEAGRDQLAA
ncbi:hypothetical protein [uncultured Adlercreutzia sp.]|uniref:hypothetical protein n=1 Tax=uncultured Adlercreutzia sp. TaxID=875803 RepID=UPI0025FC3C43|nr:hypothetical protein [uncultured Adlercreutzia sp.]